MQASSYLDYAASAPLDPRVAEAMAASAAMPGNPSSVHGFGRALRTAVDGARASVAALFGVRPADVTFTSGATEANALALLGAWRSAVRAFPGRAMSVVASPLEHASVMEALSRLASDDGARIVWLPAGKDGAVSADDVAAAIGDDTALVSVMWVNNVLGSVQPVGEIGRIAAAERARRGKGGLPIAFHCDAVQAVATTRVRPRDAGIDLLTVSAHKMCGPKGVGALVRPSGFAVEPLYAGGGQEQGMRHGTENVPGIVGFGRAAEVLAAALDDEAARYAGLRASFRAALAARAPRLEVVADAAGSSPSIMFLRHPSIPGDRLALMLDAAGFAVSAGSACDSGKRKGSHVLAAVLDERRATHGGVRVSFGRFTAERELLALADALGSLART